MSVIKLANPKIENQYIIDRVSQVLKSGTFINGPFNKEFSKKWSEYCNSNYCVPTSSGSAALTSSLKAIKKYPENRNYVIVPTLSFAATVFSVIEAGCIPIYCSVDKNGLMNQDNCLHILESQEILAIIPVHLYGQYLPIRKEIQAKTIVIEDACQAHGIRYTQGEAACFSFYPSKNLGTCGNGGAIVTNNKDIADYVQKYINYGDELGQKYQHKIYASNLRMGEIEAVVLLEKLLDGYIEKEINHRTQQARKYQELGVMSLANAKDNYYHLYPILCEHPDKMLEIFRREAIEVGRHYPYSLFDIAGGDTYYLKGFEDHSSWISQQEVSLPIGSHLTLNDIEKVSEVLHKYYKLSNNIWILRS